MAVWRASVKRPSAAVAEAPPLGKMLAEKFPRLDYFELGAERRASLGIGESLIRISTGIEDPQDLLADFAKALGD